MILRDAFEVRVDQVAQRRAPRLAHGRVAARQRDVAQVAAPLAAPIAGHQKLAAPDGPIGAVSGAVERHSDDFAREAILGHAGGDVRVMVLHAEFRHPNHPQRVLGAEIVRMEVIGHGARLHPKEFL